MNQKKRPSLLICQIITKKRNIESWPNYFLQVVLALCFNQNFRYGNGVKYTKRQS